MPSDHRAASGSLLPSVLVVGTDDWAIEQAAAGLERAGHAVARCQEPGAAAFPCVGVRDGEGCPLERGMQVVLAIRNRSAAQLAPHEMGVVCGLQRRLPLVAAGLVNDAPYRAFAAALVGQHQEISSACRDAAKAAPNSVSDGTDVAAVKTAAHSPQTEVVTP